MLFRSFDQFDTVTEPGWWGLPPALILILLIIRLNTYWARQRGLIALLFLIHHKTNELLKGTTLKAIPGAGALIWLLAFILIRVNLSGTFPLSYLITTQFKFNFALRFIIWSTLIFLGLLTSPKNSVARYLPTHSPIYLAWFLLPIEAISSIIRPLTLRFRLAANLTAGHVILSLMASLLAIFSLKHLPLFIAGACLYILFEVIISIVQAYVFILLTTIYAKENTSPKVVSGAGAPTWLSYYKEVVTPNKTRPDHVPNNNSHSRKSNKPSTWIKLQQVGARLIKFIRYTYAVRKTSLIAVVNLVYSLSESAHKTATTLKNLWDAPFHHRVKLTILRGLITTNTRRLLIKFCNRVLFKFLPIPAQKIVIIAVEANYWVIHYTLKGVMPVLACIYGRIKNIWYVYHAPWPLDIKALYLCEEIEKRLHCGLTTAHRYACEFKDKLYRTLERWGTKATAIPIRTRLDSLRTQIFHYLNPKLNVSENKINSRLGPTGQKCNHVLFKAIKALIWSTVRIPLALYIWSTGLLKATGQFFWFIRPNPPLAEKPAHHIERLTALREWRYGHLLHWLNKLFLKTIEGIEYANIKKIKTLFEAIDFILWIITGAIIILLICAISRLKTIIEAFWLICDPTKSPRDKIKYACRKSNKNNTIFFQYLADRGESLSDWAYYILYQFITKTGEFHQRKIKPPLKKIKTKVKTLFHKAKPSRKN